MERRQDLLFRQVVAHVEASLVNSGFRLFDRGGLGEYRWVEFTRLRWGPAAQPREEHLVLYHLADHRHIGARLHWRNPVARTRTGNVLMNLWNYDPGAPGGNGSKLTLCAEVHGWIADALDPAS
ncbi:MAG TPA: hypothetical protein VK066_30165 [Chloroflexota bacterium]|nr:hypothetical protein [Chloroflexota bacterium]